MTQVYPYANPDLSKKVVQGKVPKVTLRMEKCMISKLLVVRLDLRKQLS